MSDTAIHGMEIAPESNLSQADIADINPNEDQPAAAQPEAGNEGEDGEVPPEPKKDPNAPPDGCANIKCKIMHSVLWRKGWIGLDGKPVILCNPCGVLYKRNQFCQVCSQVYKLLDLEEEVNVLDPWLVCTRCNRFVHTSCNLEKKGEPHDATTKYMCPACILSVNNYRIQLEQRAARQAEQQAAAAAAAAQAAAEAAAAAAAEAAAAQQAAAAENGSAAASSGSADSSSDSNQPEQQQQQPSPDASQEAQDDADYDPNRRYPRRSRQAATIVNVSATTGTRRRGAAAAAAAAASSSSSSFSDVSGKRKLEDGEEEDGEYDEEMQSSQSKKEEKIDEGKVEEEDADDKGNENMEEDGEEDEPKQRRRAAAAAARRSGKKPKSSSQNGGSSSSSSSAAASSSSAELVDEGFDLLWEAIQVAKEEPADEANSPKVEFSAFSSASASSSAGILPFDLEISEEDRKYQTIVMSQLADSQLSDTTDS